MSDFKCDPQTRSELNASGTDKSQWINIVAAALGNDRRIRCRHTTNAASTDPWADGTEFRNVGSTGTLKISAGKIVGLGRLEGTTISLAADVSGGKAVLRITNTDGTRWVQGSLGMSAGSDFIANGYFTATNGLALRPDFGISGDPFLPTGGIPAAPALTADAPAKFRVWDYRNPAAPVLAGTALLNVRDFNITPEHPALAAEMGDIRVQRVADGAGVVLGTGGDCFRFAGELLAAHAGLNADDPTKPVYQLRIRAKPHGRWPSFPYKKDFDILNDTLAPQAFKIEILRANDTTLDWIEMYSTRTGGPGTGKAINNAEQTHYWTDTTPCQPLWTCHMSLFWASAKTKPSTKRNHFIPGVDAVSRHGSNVTAFDAAPEQWPVITDNYLANGLGQWRVAPKWSAKRNQYFDTAILDPFVNIEQMKRNEMITQAIGYGYEPGSTCHHIWFMSPGGSRHDRALIPHAIAMWLSEPNGNRPHGNIPYADLKEEWMKGYFNEGCHYYTDLERGISLQKSKLLIGNVCYNGTYYSGGNEDFTTDIPNSAINLLTTQAQGHPSEGSGYKKDKYGRPFTADYQRDDQHNYSTAALGAYLNNSPMHLLEAKSSFDSNMLCAFGFTQGSFGRDTFLTRQHAWFMGQLAQQWIVTTGDARTMSRAEVEQIWVRHLHAVWDVIYPGYLANTQTTFKFLNKMGTMLAEAGEKFYTDPNTGKLMHNGELATDSKAFYMGQVFMVMKQSGSWDAMRAKSTKCAQILDLMVTSLCKQSIDAFIDGGGRVDNNGDGDAYRNGDARFIVWYPPNFAWYENFDPPANGWASFPPPLQQRDWIRLTDGSIPTDYPDRTNTKHFRAQWLWILKRFFPEFHAGQPRLDQAITIAQNYYDTMENDPNLQWHYRFAMMGIFDAPDYIGAPV